MPKLEKVAVTWSGLVPAFTGLVREWAPPHLKNEVAYRDHLLAHIREAVPPDTKVEKEYRHSGTTIDIWLRWSGLFQKGDLAFELKLNLKKKTEFDRLVGQIESLEPRSNNVLVVLIGETDQALLGRLQDKYAGCIKPPIGTTATLAIVEITHASNAL